MREIEKIMKTTVYGGNCPICNKEQESIDMSDVDIVCMECNDNDIKRLFNYKKEQLIGAKIIDVSGYCEKSEHDDKVFFTFLSFTIETKEGKKMRIEGDSGFMGEGYLDVFEIEE